MKAPSTNLNLQSFISDLQSQIGTNPQQTQAQQASRFTTGNQQMNMTSPMAQQAALPSTQINITLIENNTFICGGGNPGS